MCHGWDRQKQPLSFKVREAVDILLLGHGLPVRVCMSKLCQAIEGSDSLGKGNPGLIWAECWSVCPRGPWPYGPRGPAPGSSLAHTAAGLHACLPRWLLCACSLSASAGGSVIGAEQSRSPDSEEVNAPCLNPPLTL